MGAPLSLLLEMDYNILEQLSQATRKSKAILQVSRQNPKFSGVPRVAEKKYVPMLVEAGFTVVLCTQVSFLFTRGSRGSRPLHGLMPSRSSRSKPQPNPDAFPLYLKAASFPLFPTASQTLTKSIR